MRLSYRRKENSTSHSPERKRKLKLSDGSKKDNYQRQRFNRRRGKKLKLKYRRKKSNYPRPILSYWSRTLGYRHYRHSSIKKPRS